MNQPAVVNFASQPGSVELREVEVPSPGPHDVIVEVRAVGVCGSDLHMWSGHVNWPVEYPIILGHEFSGIIQQVGADCGDWQVGERVTCETHATVDQNSPMTRRGLDNLDPNRKGFGAIVDGAMTRFVKVPSRISHRLPEPLSFAIAALTEPCCVAYNAVVMNAHVRPDDRVVVLGPGPIGIQCAAMARLCGAEVAFVGLERDRSRLEITREYGCDPLTDGLQSWSHAADGLGADGVIDATRASQALRTAIDIVRPNGWISKVGWGPEPIDFSLDALVHKNVCLQ